MIRVIIKNLEEIVISQVDFPTQQLAESFVERESLALSFGALEKIITNENGDPTGEIIPQQFTVEYVDASVQVLAEQEAKEALQYLKDTDFYIIREMDAGTPCPVEIKAARAAARLKV